jgi:DNA-directed RNA polymerase
MNTVEQRQIKLEDECSTLGLTQYRNRHLIQQQRGTEHLTDYGQRLMAQAIEPLEQAIKEFTTRKTPGRRHLAVPYLTLLKPDVIAFLTVKVVFAEISRKTGLGTAARNIATSIEQEIRFGEFEKQNPGLFFGVRRNLETHPLGYRQKVKHSMLNHTMKVFGLQSTKWDDTVKSHVGAALIELFQSSTGLIERIKVTKKGRVHNQLIASPILTAEIAKANSRNELLCPVLLPMLCPPRPWVNLTGGGYLTDRFAYTVVKMRTRGYFRESAVREMPEFYEAVNALQSTAWRVNTAVLAVAQQAWDAGLAVSDMPPREWAPKLPKPGDFETNPDAKKRWRQQNADVFRDNLRNDAHRMSCASMLRIAEQFKDETSIYFPVQVDFRGRMYYRPPKLNPQGTDLAKALLTFAEAKPLGDTGAWWLAIHLANCFGEDKISMEDRVKWTCSNTARIVAIAADPMSDLWWTEADKGDKAFQFLAACFEWAGYQREGIEYRSSLPLTVDGTCNGIQNFAAMLRDEVSGRQVNLVPQKTPADIYGEVASKLEVELRADGSEYALNWLAFGIDRHLCKRPVMVLPYGGTQKAVRQYIAEYAQEKGHSMGLTFGKHITYLSPIMWKVMREVVVGPMDCMDWLREISRMVSKEGVPLTWTTPTGFLVQQVYNAVNRRRVKTRMGEQFVFVSYMQSKKDKLDNRKMSQAVAPNFIHSLDAAALAKTLCLCLANGMSSFTAIHDSYGTHAADMAKLQACIREAFVLMYRTDILQKFAEEIGSYQQIRGKVLPPPPERGGLDLEAIRESEFFFH